MVFDERFELRPSAQQANDRWGGYRAEFKLIERDRHAALDADLESIRRNALATGAEQRRSFRIDISKFEFCDGKEEADVEAYTIFVYSKAMIAAEKLRAICQQMPEYSQRRWKTARARDFYDIHGIVQQGGVDLASEENLDLIRSVFAAKEVPLTLLRGVEGQRDFHRADWPSVQASVRGELESFDYYFDFVALHHNL